MLIGEYVELSVVKLRSGKIGTLVHLYDGENAACIELDETNELLNVEFSEIESVLWEPESK